MSIIFARPHFHYASYADYYQLIALSDFDTCYIDEIDQSSDNIYIVTIYNGEFGDYSGSHARIILTDLEYHMGDNALPPLPNVEIWACDAWYAKQIGAKYWAMGSHSALKHMDLRRAIDATNHWGNGGDVYDVAYIGFIQGLQRREVIRQQLIGRGVRVSPMVAWDGERYHILTTSCAYLHVHQHAHIPAVPPLRMVVAAAYSLPVISETCADAGLLTGFVRMCDYGELADTAKSMTHHLSYMLENYGAGLHQVLCIDYPFRRSIENAL